MIVSVDVRTKLPVGTMLYCVYASGTVKQCVVEVEPFCTVELGNATWKTSVRNVENGTPVGHQHNLYLGDEGITGYTYDDRPPRMAKTLATAEVLCRAWPRWVAMDEQRRRMRNTLYAA